MIESPNYPEDYPDNVLCRKVMNAPTGNNVRLTFYDFVLEDSQECEWDYVSIYDSNAADEELLIGTYCGTELAPGAVFESTGSDMHVLFVSDGSFHEKGFQAMFEFVPGKNYTFHSIVSPREGFLSMIKVICLV